MPNFASKIGRNDTCPCGSKKKYKKCHGGINPPPAPLPGMVDAQIRKLAPDRVCLVPKSMLHECSKGAIDAHTVSRSGSLGAIAREGHVYSYRVSTQSLAKSKGKLIPSLTGWHAASTFPGFCSIHDKKLFSPLEDACFTGSKQQCFLLAYRAIARELYTKHRSALQSGYRQALSRGNKGTQAFASDFNQGVDLGLRDVKVHKQAYDDVLTSENWDAVRTSIFEFDGIFPIQCAAAFFPTEDVYGKTLQKLGYGGKTPDALSIISFSADGRSYICFCWLADSDRTCDAYVRALRTVDTVNLPVVLASCLLQTNENCHFSPDWYEALSPSGKEWCAHQMMNGIPLFNVPPPICNVGLPYLGGVTIS